MQIPTSSNYLAVDFFLFIPEKSLLIGVQIKKDIFVVCDEYHEIQMNWGKLKKTIAYRWEE